MGIETLLDGKYLRTLPGVLRAQPTRPRRRSPNMNAAIPEHKPTSDEISAKDNPASAKTAAPRGSD